MNKEAFVTQLSFHFSPASAHILPLQNIRQRLRGLWDTLTWPMLKRILKADLAITILFAMLFVEPLRKRTEYGLILGQVAVAFMHPGKPYGLLVEVNLCLLKSLSFCLCDLLGAQKEAHLLIF